MTSSASFLLTDLGQTILCSICNFGLYDTECHSISSCMHNFCGPCLSSYHNKQSHNHKTSSYVKNFEARTNCCPITTCHMSIENIHRNRSMEDTSNTFLKILKDINVHSSSNQTIDSDQLEEPSRFSITTNLRFKEEDEDLIRATLNKHIFEKCVECGICMGIIIQASTLLPCHHTFCGKCLSDWHSSQHPNCPICRSFIEIVKKNETINTQAHIYLKMFPEHQRNETELLEWQDPKSITIRYNHSFAHSQTTCQNMIEAIENNNIPELKLLLENMMEHSIVNHVNSDGRTPLVIACDLGRPESVKLLLQYRADTEITDDGKTPLIWACDKGNAECCYYLAEAGCNLNCKSFFGVPAMAFAAGRGHSACVQVLVDFKADVNVHNNDNVTPIMYAVDYWQPECIKVLAKAGANLTQQDRKGCTPLSKAIIRRNFELIKYLLTHGSEEIKYQIPEILLTAIYSIDMEIFAYLVKNSKGSLNQVIKRVLDLYDNSKESLIRFIHNDLQVLALSPYMDPLRDSSNSQFEYPHAYTMPNHSMSMSTQSGITEANSVDQFTEICASLNFYHAKKTSKKHNHRNYVNQFLLLHMNQLSLVLTCNQPLNDNTRNEINRQHPYESSHDFSDILTQLHNRYESMVHDNHLSTDNKSCDNSELSVMSHNSRRYPYPHPLNNLFNVASRSHLLTPYSSYGHRTSGSIASAFAYSQRHRLQQRLQRPHEVDRDQIRRMQTSSHQNNHSAATAAVAVSTHNHTSSYASTSHSHASTEAANHVADNSSNDTFSRVNDNDSNSNRIPVMATADNQSTVANDVVIVSPIASYAVATVTTTSTVINFTNSEPDIAVIIPITNMSSNFETVIMPMIMDTAGGANSVVNIPISNMRSNIETVVMPMILNTTGSANSVVNIPITTLSDVDVIRDMTSSVQDRDHMSLMSSSNDQVLVRIQSATLSLRNSAVSSDSPAVTSNICVNDELKEHDATDNNQSTSLFSNSRGTNDDSYNISYSSSSNIDSSRVGSNTDNKSNNNSDSNSGNNRVNNETKDNDEDKEDDDDDDERILSDFFASNSYHDDEFMARIDEARRHGDINGNEYENLIKHYKSHYYLKFMHPKLLYVVSLDKETVESPSVKNTNKNLSFKSVNTSTAIKDQITAATDTDTVMISTASETKAQPVFYDHHIQIRNKLLLQRQQYCEQKLNKMQSELLEILKLDECEDDEQIQLRTQHLVRLFEILEKDTKTCSSCIDTQYNDDNDSCTCMTVKKCMDILAKEVVESSHHNRINNEMSDDKINTSHSHDHISDTGNADNNSSGIDDCSSGHPKFSSISTASVSPSTPGMPRSHINSSRFDFHTGNTKTVDLKFDVEFIHCFKTRRNVLLKYDTMLHMLINQAVTSKQSYQDDGDGNDDDDDDDDCDGNDDDDDGDGNDDDAIKMYDSEDSTFDILERYISNEMRSETSTTVDYQPSMRIIKLIKSLKVASAVGGSTMTF